MSENETKIPLVSILIPTYNRAVFFQQALESVLSQTYKNIEVIVCDNSENDETKNLVEAYQKVHSHIRYYKNETNLKYIGNMRRCLELASGEYINFLMDDDLFMPQKIEKMMAFCLIDQAINLVTSPRIIINQVGEVIEPRLMGLKVTGNWVGSGRELAKLSITNIENFLGEPTTVLFKKAALKFPFGTYYHHEFLVLSDLVTWYSILEEGKAVYLSEPLSYFRKHSEQNTAQNEKKWEGKIPGFDEAAKIADIVASTNFYDTKVEYTRFVVNILSIYTQILTRLINEKGEHLEIPEDYAQLMYNIISKI
ncbi:glycosyltransferase family 2 protein [Turicibacter sanguinis]|uniref:glycosyltransferase family 2 protein n=1 Tax=Turicibacter sanguinis TaxID=154288 RepID=UPI0018A9FE92|nr:glycosyltransferase [Turicibacter sanguinis]MDB8566201.1 glycosyltransferase [Turicibacter sanguinis]MDB8568935.1 glycosyltransferase [Turicibacter sanguinis]MDB8571702.1 glycosyltransferase [Turicibacter sanguinis]MDB8580444.1 glycosyltransferase [Turicibacter sanguinis]